MIRTSKFSTVLLAVAVFTSAGAMVNQSSQAKSVTKADNSVVNKRDHSETSPTADHQANGSKSDVELTRLIRRELTSSNDLSVYGKNIKIITEGGNVILRGPVHTLAEKNKIGEIAQTVAGNQPVQNLLEIKQ